MKILVDGTVVAQSSGSGGTISTMPKLTPGAHILAVQAADSSGAVASSSEGVMAVNQPPQAVLSVSTPSGTAPTLVTATTTRSTDPDGSVVASSITWGDGTAKSTSFSASHTYTAPGAYTVTATVTDDYGATSTTIQKVTIAAPVTRSITVISPAPGVYPSRTVHMSAIGYAPLKVVAMQVYVDNKLRYQANSATLDTMLALTTGNHYVVFQGWDASGAYWKSGRNISVP
jgi:PKD repeat protein